MQGDLILDPFGGSGSTLMACEQTGRQCVTMELDPHFVDVIVLRWQDATGKIATHSETLESFKTVSEKRAQGGLYE